MTLLSAANGAFRSLTGFQIQRAPRKPAPKAAAPKPSPTPRPKAPQFPADYDDQSKEIITAVKPWTMTSHEKLHALIAAVRYVAQNNVPGDVVECGVWRGGSMQAVARTLLACGVKDRDLHLYDTFEGMSEPTEEDVRKRDGKTAAELLASQGKDRAVWALAGLEEVKEGMRQIPYPAERVHYVQGKVEDTVPGHAPEQISILRLDTDWYASTRHELEHLYPRLVSGGVLLLDDYGYWDGAKQAVDEFLHESGEKLLLVRMASGRIAVKP